MHLKFIQRQIGLPPWSLSSIFSQQFMPSSPIQFVGVNNRPTGRTRVDRQRWWHEVKIPSITYLYVEYLVVVQNDLLEVHSYSVYLKYWVMKNFTVAEKPEEVVVYTWPEQYDRNITLVTDSRQCQPCWQNDLAGRTSVPPSPPPLRKKAWPSVRSHPWVAYIVSRAYITVRVQTVHVEIASMVKS